MNTWRSMSLITKAIYREENTSMTHQSVCSKPVVVWMSRHEIIFELELSYTHGRGSAVSSLLHQLCCSHGVSESKSSAGALLALSLLMRFLARRLIH